MIKMVVPTVLPKKKRNVAGEQRVIDYVQKVKETSEVANFRREINYNVFARVLLHLSIF